MNSSLLFTGLLAFSYLIGSISSAILVCKWMHLPDPRTTGSGNPGMTNVLRSGSKMAGILTLLGDALKGWIPVALGIHLGFAPALCIWLGLAAIIGHMFPIFFQFKGGKGVATALGMLIGLSWVVAVAWGITWLLTAIITRYSSLASMLATALSIFYMAVLMSHSTIIPMTIITLLIVWKHRSNIQRLLAGTENKFKSKKSA